MPGFVSADPRRGQQLAGTGVVQCVAGILTNTATAGAARDTMLMGVYIQATAATATTLTITGMVDNTGSAQPMLISGQVSTDVYWEPTEPILNYDAAFTFQASAANKVWVFLRAYIGPERPETRVNT